MEERPMIEQLTDEIRRRREPGHDVSALLLNRWSPRSMTGETLRDDELMPLFEAARWAPSSFNGQPWRFVYAKRDTVHWQRFLALLVEQNRSWAQKAAALVVVASRKNFERNGKPARTHAFDAGAAWENLAIEGARRGLVVHGMEGFDYDRARTELEIGEEYEVLAMIAIGRRGPRDELPEPLRKVEEPNGRRPLHEIVFEGTLRAK
jgi:nitroreductase